MSKIFCIFASVDSVTKKKESKKKLNYDKRNKPK